MYYAIPKAGSACRAGLLGLGLLLFASAVWGQEQPPRFLEVTSQGYSRYEISDGDVVAFFTGGVQCVYLGYTLTMDELRYNQATQVATANGNVRLTSAAVNLSCDTAILDGAKGQLVVDANLSGELSDLGLGFTADSSIVHFPPGQLSSGLDTLDLELVGAGDAGVQITGPNHSLLTAHQFKFTGKTRKLTCPGSFMLTADLDQPTPADTSDASQPVDMQRITLSGISLDAVLDASGMVSEAVIRAANLATAGTELSSDELRLKLLPPPDPASPVWTVEASGNPITGHATREAQTVSFSTQNATITTSGQDEYQIELHGAVEVATASGVMYADVVQIHRQQRGFAISAPQGLRVAFDMAALSGSTPVDLPELSKFSPQE